MELWRTGNAEARILALQVSDPQRLTRADADRLLRDSQTHFLGCYLAGLLGRSPIARDTMRSWMASSGEFTREMGYGILSAILKKSPTPSATPMPRKSSRTRFTLPRTGLGTR